MNVLELDQLSLRLGDQQILHELHCRVAAKERIALLGRNGAGKTTLLRCLLGRLAYQGSVRLGGQELRDVSATLRARRLAYVPQRLELPFAYAVEDFLKLSQYALRDLLSEAERRSLRARAVEYTGAAHFLERPLPTLSMGERQRVLLAAALSQGADTLLLDEPTAFLDPRGIEQFFSLLDALPSETTLLLATHEVNFAAFLCSRVIALSEGTISYDVSMKDFMQEAPLRHVFGIEPQLLRHEHSDVPFLLPPGGER